MGPPMTEEEFLRYVAGVDWRFAKSVPNWPHFYIVEKELDDQEAFRAAIHSGDHPCYVSLHPGQWGRVRMGEQVDFGLRQGCL